jgi:hypothetical protein
MKLLGRLLPVPDVTSTRRDAMYALMDRHYENVRRSTFDADLDEKQWVIELRDPATDELCGFSTQRLIEQEVDGRSVIALFSGDTIISPDRWGDNALAHVWGRLALSVIDAHPDTELYWFLLSKGYKTYRYLPLFFHEFFPSSDRPVPSRIRSVLDALASSRYPNSYDSHAGIVRADATKDRLRPGIADVCDGRMNDRHVRFFVERNPGHERGDELCCLAPLTRDNFTRAAWRVINLDSVPALAIGAAR